MKQVKRTGDLEKKVGVVKLGEIGKIPPSLCMSENNGAARRA
jgi:hypothetical protein